MVNSRIALPFLCLILSTVLVLPFSSCQTYLDFAGYAYEWTNAPAGAASKIIEADRVPEGYQVKPLEGVTVDAEDKDGSHPFQMVSNELGYFHKALYVEIQEDIIAKVNYPGYNNTILQFGVHKDRYFYSLIVLLVPAG